MPVVLADAAAAAIGRLVPAVLTLAEDARMQARAVRDGFESGLESGRPAPART